MHEMESTSHFFHRFRFFASDPILSPASQDHPQMQKKLQRTVSLAIAILTSLGIAGSASAGERPNVVLIVCDDLNDYVEGMEGHPQARTPGLKSLAESGVMFRRAYSSNPICAPSRASLFTGLYSHTTKNAGFDPTTKNPVQSGVKMIPELFHENGYTTIAAGKVLHYDSEARNRWPEYVRSTDYGPIVWDGKSKRTHPDMPKPFGDIGRLNGSFGSLANVPYAADGDPATGWVTEGWRKIPKPWRYVSEDDRDRTPDELTADWAVEWLKKRGKENSPEPFFITLGFLRPHTPLHAPQKYFDMFPIDQVQLPVTKANDNDDTYQWVGGSKSIYRLLGKSYPSLEQGLRLFTQAYLACIASVDEQVARVVTAIDANGLSGNTIIILTSDHGFNMGEKEWVGKNVLWEESARVPFIVRAPGITKPGGIAEHPIGLIDLYPTLVDLCGLKGETVKNEMGRPLDGHSLRPFLIDPSSGRWDGPEAALTTVNGGGPDTLGHNHSIRTLRWRYIRYKNGAEELYDHDGDPYEWTNLAADPAQKSTVQHLRNMLSAQLGVKLTNVE
ncbi:MAG: Choline-sulfatase [Planctomycetota bacterium]